MIKEVSYKYKTKSGWLCLDFTNTVEWHASSHPEDTLLTYHDLIMWAEKVSIVSPDEAKSMLHVAGKQPEKAKEILDHSIKLREAVYRILSSEAEGIDTNENDLATLNSTITRMIPNLKLVKISRNFALDWTVNTKNLESVLWPVVWSTIELLTSDGLERVGRCADDRGCGWLFWDNSRNRSRRWCDMKDCGNRAKSRRHYRKYRIPDSGENIY